MKGPYLGSLPAIMTSGAISSTRIPSGISERLEGRAAAGALRALMPRGHGIDLCSNDYLGLAQRPWPAEILDRLRDVATGAGASRLVSGSLPCHEGVETYLSDFYRTESCLLIGSGFEANTALLGALGGRGDTLLYDEFSHASMRDGLRLSLGRSYSFRHNDLDDLRAKLQRATGDRYVIVESLYSMDGDCAPLEELSALCDEQGAYLIVDEAHSTGLFGDEGRGLVCANGLEAQVFARVLTFGKALGYKGACIAGPEALRSYVVNFARPFIYTTAEDPISTLLIREAHERARAAHKEREQLSQLIRAVVEMRERFPSLSLLPSNTAVQGVVVPGNTHVVAAERTLQNAGFGARAIRAPTVPEGQERIRLCLHAFNTACEIEEALSILATHLEPVA